MKAPGFEPRGIAIAGSFTAGADSQGGPRLILRDGGTGVGHVIGGRRVPSNTGPERANADILLRTDGRSMTEEDGPTALWADFGSWPGLIIHFPTNPESSSVGAGGRWAIGA